MEITAIKCPNCAGSINYLPGQRAVKCPYCDSVLDIKADPAEIALDLAKKKYQNADAARVGYLNNLRSWKTKGRILLTVQFALTMISYFLTEINSKGTGLYNFGMMLVVAVFVSIFAGPIWLKSKIPPAPQNIEEQLKLKGSVLLTIKLVALSILAMFLGLIAGVILYR